MEPIKSTKKRSYSTAVLVFMNGFLLATLLYSCMEDNYEKQIFENIAGYIKSKTSVISHNEESVLLHSLHLTHYLGSSREVVFYNRKMHSLKQSLLHTVTYDLLTAGDACGSYALILSRLLNELNINNRIAQMMVNGQYGGHILVEAQTAKGWVVLDPMYDLHFTQPNGQMAGFTDVHSNWAYYREQVPAGYKPIYSYQGVRYTNWDKVPVLMPLLKKILHTIIGRERTEALSLRVFFLRKFHIVFQVTAIGIVLINLMAFGKYIRRRQVMAVYSPYFLQMINASQKIFQVRKRV